MSSHYIRKDLPPPGTTSFTKIRLGWISPEQVVFVRPGEERGAFLSPLATGGEVLVIKIPLPGDKYYLVENRQAVGYDKVQPDSGILILKVNPFALEGTGTVQIMDADPGSANLSHATFRIDQPGRELFVDRQNNVAIVPIWSQGETLGVLVTTAVKGADALQATQMIQKLWHQRAHKSEKKQIVDDCISAYRQYDFKRSGELARQAM
jgi:hypothetical protein